MSGYIYVRTKRNTKLLNNIESENRKNGYF